MTTLPILPITQITLTPREASMMLQGLAEFVDALPTSQVTLTIDIQRADTGASAPTKSPQKRKAASRTPA